MSNINNASAQQRPLGESLSPKAPNIEIMEKGAIPKGSTANAQSTNRPPLPPRK